MSPADTSLTQVAPQSWLIYKPSIALSRCGDSVLEHLEAGSLQGQLSNARQFICELLIENQKLRMKVWAAIQATADNGQVDGSVFDINL